MKTKIYYSVQNYGDGTAHPVFFSSQELADLHQKHQCEGWAEDCVGFIEIESDNPIQCVQVQTRKDMLKELHEDLFDENGELESWVDDDDESWKFYQDILMLDQ
jgi:hypothetical protein